MENPARSRKKGPTTSAKGKGKQPKRFLEKNDALALAASIAGVQETKSLSKAEKHHQIQVGQPHEDSKPRLSASKVKLKETKALLSAQRSRVKKDKAKLRKRGPQDSVPSDVNNADPSSGPPKTGVARKSVSFA